MRHLRKTFLVEGFFSVECVQPRRVSQSRKVSMLLFGIRSLRANLRSRGLHALPDVGERVGLDGLYDG